MRCSVSNDCHMISSYDRLALKQTRSGYFSPIGGYHVGRDMTLVLDVARFKYPLHWVPLSLLWEAMGYVDKSTGQQRGAVKMRVGSVLQNISWMMFLLLEWVDMKDIEKVLSLIVTSLPSNFGEFIKWIAEVRRREDGDQSLSPEEKARVTVNVLKKLRVL